MQQIFNPVNYGFNWTDDGWYEFDHAAAHKAARKARDVEAKRLRAAGREVFCGSMSGQLMTRGGIGSGHPEIEVVVTVYMLTVYDR